MNLVLLLLLACAPTPVPPAAAPEAAQVAPAGLGLADLELPGDARVAAAARQVLATWLDLHPDLAADAGLLADGLSVPSYAPERVQQWVAAFTAHRATLAAIDPAGLDVADRIDLRLLQLTVDTALQALEVEQRWRHRPAEWLEPVGTLLIAHAAAPEPLPHAVDRIAGQLPAMLDELRREVTEPTARDVATALDLVDGIVQMLQTGGESPARAAAVEALQAYAAELQALDGLPEHRVIGAEAYAWRLEHALLLPWTPEELRARAEADLARVDAEIARLSEPPPQAAPPTEAERAQAETLDQAAVLALYDALVQEDLAALRAMDVLTVPEDLPPLRARPTPPALIPLTGDGGSMNPVALFGPTHGAWWNVEHMPPDQDFQARLGTVTTMRRHRETWFGPYGVHEGVPGHHLQLAIARSVPRPVRLLLQSTPSVEGWALYAEQLFEENGGFSGTVAGRLAMLRSYRARIRRVLFSVPVETGQWTLQQAADWKQGAAPGEGRLDAELLRTVQWPTQLIAYYAGKAQIEALREECRQAWGEGYSERRFHDALLAQGPIPVALAREALLAEAP